MISFVLGSVLGYWVGRSIEKRASTFSEYKERAKRWFEKW